MRLRPRSASVAVGAVYLCRVADVERVLKVQASSPALSLIFFRPFGACLPFAFLPSAGALGCNLSLLRGCGVLLTGSFRFFGSPVVFLAFVSRSLVVLSGATSERSEGRGAVEASLPAILLLSSLPAACSMLAPRVVRSRRVAHARVRWMGDPFA